MNTHKYALRAFLDRYHGDEQPLSRLLVSGLLPTLSANGPWIAGGAVRRAVKGEKSIDSDVDLFFANADQLSAAAKSMESSGAVKCAETEHVVGYSINFEGALIPVQLIRIGYYADAASLLDSFDFTICQFATDGESLIVGEFSLFDLARRRLALHRLTYGVATVRRLIKYTRQGFTACGGVLADILESAVADPKAIGRSVEYVD